MTSQDGKRDVSNAIDHKNDENAGLDALLKELIALLQGAGETLWSSRLQGDRALLVTDPNRGRDSVRGKFGSMGSLNDLWLSAHNGHAIDSDSEQALNQRVSELLDRIWASVQDV